jgi:hypothetical protein
MGKQVNFHCSRLEVAVSKGSTKQQKNKIMRNMFYLCCMVLLMLCLQGCSILDEIYFIYEKTSIFTIRILFIVIAIFQIGSLYLGKKASDECYSVLSFICYLLSGISFICVLALWMPFFVSFSSEEFLTHTTHYTSGRMDGYGFIFWSAIFFYSIVFWAIFGEK